MNKNTLLVALCGIFALGLLTGCGGARPLVDDPTISLNYLKEPSEENLTTLSKAYAQALNRNRKEQVKQPGLAAEYAITLALLGDQQQANQWFNREVADFPASRDYVVALKSIYCPAYSADQTQASGEIALEQPAAPAAEESDALTGADAAVQQVIDQEQASLAGGQSQPQVKQKSSAPVKSKAKSKGKKGKKSKKGKKPAKKAKKH